MIDFDVAKDQANILKHGLPLGAAALLFDGPYIEERGRSPQELRGNPLHRIRSDRAVFGNRIFVVIYTWRDGVRRVISFRKANDREVRKYQASQP